ncbi:hypothetical protein RRG08_060030 [Elysia crispata]|uniref:Uncharacterized protein n=1 Tax=Elysia crispata TaxID=231223 RepID=A0AAE1CX61_9GAST|nr:hypothetical protein RRG08_060030 [Elysia crispata]
MQRQGNEHSSKNRGKGKTSGYCKWFQIHRVHCVLRLRFPWRRMTYILWGMSMFCYSVELRGQQIGTKHFFTWPMQDSVTKQETRVKFALVSFLSPVRTAMLEKETIFSHADGLRLCFEKH